MSKWLRRFYHLSKSGCLTGGIEHFLVMFPSAVLIAKMAITKSGEPIITLPTLLIACGFGTLLFIIFTNRKHPLFLGPSFVYISLTTYYISTCSDIEKLRSTVLWSYIMAGILLFLLSLLYQLKSVRKLFSFLFPSTVMGPAISLIGLELANIAAADAGFLTHNTDGQILAIITLLIIILGALIKNRFFNNASVLLGVIIGSVIATFLQDISWPVDSLYHLPFSLPTLHLDSLFIFPTNIISITVSVIPSVIIAFAESLGRIQIYEGMTKRDDYKGFNSNSILKAQSLSNLLTASFCFMPSAIYAENLAIMNLRNTDLSTRQSIINDDDKFIVNCYSPYSIYPYVIASILSIIVACINGLQNFLIALPLPVIGGMELFIFGLISAPGVQILVDQQVNYKKVSNQIITAIVLLAGVSNIAIDFKLFVLQGMSLGLTVGVLVNLLVRFLETIGYLNEKITLPELIRKCLSVFDPIEPINISICEPTSDHRSSPIETASYTATFDILNKYLNQKVILNKLSNSKKIEIKSVKGDKPIKILQTPTNFILSLRLDLNFQKKLINDHQIIITQKKGQEVDIVITEALSPKLLLKIIKASL